MSQKKILSLTQAWEVARQRCNAWWLDFDALEAAGRLREWTTDLAAS